MNIIIKKVKIIASPAPPFVGTRLGIRIVDDADFAFYKATLADDSTAVRIEWGDGMSVELPADQLSAVSHSYPGPGEYEIRISDDIKSVSFTGTGLDYVRTAAMIRSFSTTGTKLRTLNIRAFKGCVNLVSVDLSAAFVSTFQPGVFENCTGLSGIVRLDSVATLQGNVQPFNGCTGGIAEIHFSSANEATIAGSTVYTNDPTLGTGTATIKFDPAR